MARDRVCVRAHVLLVSTVTIDPSLNCVLPDLFLSVYMSFRSCSCSSSFNRIYLSVSLSCYTGSFSLSLCAVLHSTVSIYPSLYGVVPDLFLSLYCPCLLWLILTIKQIIVITGSVCSTVSIRFCVASYSILFPLFTFRSFSWCSLSSYSYQYYYLCFELWNYSNHPCFLWLILTTKQIIVITRRFRSVVSIDPSLYRVVWYPFSSIYVSFLFLFFFVLLLLLWILDQYLIRFERTSFAGRWSHCSYPSLLQRLIDKNTEYTDECSVDSCIGRIYHVSPKYTVRVLLDRRN